MNNTENNNYNQLQNNNQSVNSNAFLNQQVQTVINNPNIQNNNQTKHSDKSLKSKVKVLLVTNIITLILLIVFILLFIYKDKGNSNLKENQSVNKADYSVTATDNPVSKDWKDYQFSINGKTLTLPCSYKEFKEISNFHMKSSDEKSYIQPRYSTNINLYKELDGNDKLALYVDIKNNTANDLPYIDSQIVRVSQTTYQVETNHAEKITFPNDLKVGMEISKEEIINLLGEPQNIREYIPDETYSSVTLKYIADPDYTTINFYEIVIVNGKIQELSLDHKKEEK